jgi:hypothetical protein
MMNNQEGCSADVCGLKYVSHTHKFLFFEIPKNGSESLIALLTEHASLSRLRGRFSFLDYPFYTKFAFVRNPWDRILSCYLNKIKTDANSNNDKFKDGVMKKFQRFGVFYPGMSFESFVATVHDIPDDIADGHFASQYTRLVMDNKIVVDRVGRFEHFQHEVNSLLKNLGINQKVVIPHLGKAERRTHY